ncbi:hypothetical protein [Persicobacter sp. CCB-QB2]|uniref:hypothetical protein n=1 Tax=Persicobacter sp. CCB-QB2 TaxID=1561025 RepID=UPI0006A9FF82|nr:hypothetical protein [Persicobacter sp. CCB-QB2]
MREPQQLFTPIDQWISHQGIEFKSVDPGKNTATSFAALAEKTALEFPDFHHFQELALLCRDLIQSQYQHYPQNIFYDYDLMVREIVKMTFASDHPTHFLRKMDELLVQLMGIFGGNTTINFQFVHDFTYGFDWAKWVAKNPQERKQIPPFHPEFLKAMVNRGKEMLELIKINDQKYHQLQPQQGFRNPFSYQRDPENEESLMRQLFAHGMIPVPLWDWNGQAHWEMDYQEARKQMAQKIQKHGS